MDLVLCHLTADFDTLGAAVGVSLLNPGTRIVLAGGCHPTVRDFLALHRGEYALIERRSVSEDQIRSITVVDTQQRDRLGSIALWLDLPDCTITVYDHHSDLDHHRGQDDKNKRAMESGAIVAQHYHVASVGAATTLIVEALQHQQVIINSIEATVMALGIHADTGSLTFDHTTVRDAAALTWLMAQGANPRVIAEYVEPGLSPALQDLLPTVLTHIQVKSLGGISLAWVKVSVNAHTPGLSSLTSRIMDLTESDVLIFASHYPSGDGTKMSVIGRSRSGSFGTAHLDAIDLGQIFRELGGGGHAKAAAVTLHFPSPSTSLASSSPNLVSELTLSSELPASELPASELTADTALEQILTQVESQLPSPAKARTLMSSPVRTIRPDISIAEAHRILLRYGHSGLSVVDSDGRLVGIISRRDLDIALHHNFSHAPVKGFMSTNLKTIGPDMSLPEIESLMVTYDIGRLPVLDGDEMVGIVTRTDVLRQLHQTQQVLLAQQTDENGPQSAGFSQMGKKTDEKSSNLLAPLGSISSELSSLQRFNHNHPRRDCPLPQTMTQRLRDRLIPELWDLLQSVALEAETRGWHLYVVGGAVRDLLLAKDGDPFLIPDVDLVVDGCHRQDETAAGVELAKALQKHYPNARLQVHGRFQTAALLWHHDPVLKSLWLDIATARTEFYPYPAANPEVEASSIRQDLYRRDFTINALAIRLTSPRAGELLDFFGGTLDLKSHHIRVLHPNSFIEDPTRIFRAVRFSVRLDFKIEPQTRRYIRHAIASGIYHQVQTEMDVAPALQTRLRKELQYILEAPYWRTAIQLLADLNALQCIHADLALSPKIWWQLRLVDRWLKRFDPDSQLAHWLVLLEVVISHLDDPYPKTIAENLQLPTDSIRRLSQFKAIYKDLHQTLMSSTADPTPNPITPPSNPPAPPPLRSPAPPLPPSAITTYLKPYDRSTLILVGVRSDRPLRRLIWKYLAHWSHVKAPLNGNDLKELGYKPGRQFKWILNQLLAATLDENIETAADAKIFLTTLRLPG
ncbi:MAG: CBS domain-containing protein [Cyanobacteria bacterium P01_F01_bin.150]